MITPQPLAGLVAADPIAACKAAIVARLATLLPGVKIVSHPGKVDISEVVGKSVVASPGVAVGWSRVRVQRLIDGSFALLVDWTAYVVVENKVIANARVEREVIGVAIGRRLVETLEDADEQTWGLGNVTPPSADPPPELRPLFTVRELTEGAAYYAVTWTQTLVDQGTPLFAGATPIAAIAADGAIEFDWSEGEAPPPEVTAWLDQEDP